MERNLLEGIVLTGGGALLNGMCDMAERVLNCQAGNGLAKGIRRLAGGTEHTRVDHRRRSGDVFGEIENCIAAAARACPALWGWCCR